MKTFVVSEIIWLIYCVGIVLLTHALLLPVVFYFSGWVIYGLAWAVVKGFNWYRAQLMLQLAEKGLKPGDLVE